MPFNVIVKEEAHLDMLHAYQYYEQQREGLGDLFLSMLQERLTAISEHPEYYSYIDNKKMLRDITINIFPFVIVFEQSDNDVIVYAICSTHTQPLNY